MRNKLNSSQLAALKPTAEERAAYQAMKPKGTPQALWDSLNEQLDNDESRALAGIHDFLVTEYRGAKTTKKASAKRSKTERPLKSDR